MKTADLPNLKAIEPVEEAHQPQATEEPGSEMPPFMGHRPRKITFTENTEYNDNVSSQKSSSYREVLSQPCSDLSHRQRLLWLQKRRTTGLWAQCDSCERWRYLPNVLDRYELPKKWYCWLNSDKSLASCSVPEVPIPLCEEEDLIHSEYSTGSVVWAKLAGWPWWPAMVDDCPDAEQFYWLDGFSDIPTHYNVVFFDATEVTRAWVAPENMKPYSANKMGYKTLLKNKAYRQRIKAAMEQAEEAETLSLPARLTKFSFISRHTGKITSPKKINAAELERYKKRFKSKYHVDLTIESTDSEDDANVDKAAKRKNVIILGTPKSGKKSKGCIISENGVSQDGDERTTKKHVQRKLIVSEAPGVPHDSLVAEAGSTSEPPATESFDDDTSKTYVPENESAKEVSSQLQEFTIGIETPKSDDFDF